MSNRKKKNHYPEDNNAPVQNENQAENQDTAPSDEPGDTQDTGLSDQPAETEDTDPAADPEKIDLTETESVDLSVEDIEDRKKDWMEELKEELQSINETIKRGARIEAEAEEAQQSTEPPARSKDDMQRELEQMKAGFEHTPLEMTPELQKLLHQDIKEKGKKEKKARRRDAVCAGQA